MNLKLYHDGVLMCHAVFMWSALSEIVQVSI